MQALINPFYPPSLTSTDHNVRPDSRTSLLKSHTQPANISFAMECFSKKGNSLLFLSHTLILAKFSNDFSQPTHILT